MLFKNEILAIDNLDEAKLKQRKREARWKGQKKKKIGKNAEANARKRKGLTTPCGK